MLFKALTSFCFFASLLSCTAAPPSRRSIENERVKRAQFNPRRALGIQRRDQASPTPIVLPEGCKTINVLQKICGECLPGFAFTVRYGRPMCYRLPEGCLELDYDYGTCVRCETGRSLVSEYLDYKCRVLPPNCRATDYAGTCTDCLPAFFKSGSDCVSRCGTLGQLGTSGFTSEGECTCSAGYSVGLLVNGLSACNALPSNCLTINYNGVCTLCEPAYSKIGLNCTPRCKTLGQEGTDGMTATGECVCSGPNRDVQLLSYGYTDASKTSCSKCDATSMFDGYKCVAVPLGCTAISPSGYNRKCTACDPQGSHPFLYNDTCNVCAPGVLRNGCYSANKRCKAYSSTGRCTACIAGYSLDASNRCIFCYSGGLDYGEYFNAPRDDYTEPVGPHTAWVDHPGGLGVCPK